MEMFFTVAGYTIIYSMVAVYIAPPIACVVKFFDILINGDVTT